MVVKPSGASYRPSSANCGTCMAAIFLLGLPRMKGLSARLADARDQHRPSLIETAPAAIFLVRMRRADRLVAHQAGLFQPLPDSPVGRLLVAGARTVNAIGWLMGRNRSSTDTTGRSVRLHRQESITLHLSGLKVVAPRAAIPSVRPSILDRRPAHDAFRPAQPV